MAAWSGRKLSRFALFCAMTMREGEVAETLWCAAAVGGDSGTTGSLTGNLLGAMLGDEALPGGVA